MSSPPSSQKGERLNSYYEEAYWNDVGTMGDFEKVNDEVLAMQTHDRRALTHGMNPNAARASVIVLSFVVLGDLGARHFRGLVVPLSAQALPRALVSLVVFVSAYYVGANLLFWKAVVRISSSQLPRQA